MKKGLMLIALGIFANGSVNAAETEKIEPTLNGSISVVSAYVSRGGTNSPENPDAAVQGSLTAGYNGFYASYWFSKIDYAIKELQGKKANATDYYENDLFLGYASSYGRLDYDVFTAIYYYPGGKHVLGFETGVNLSTKLSERNDRVSLSLMTYVNDVVYANQGDTYMTLGYSYPFKDKWSVDLITGMSYFQDNGKYEGDIFLNTQKGFAFRYFATKLNRKIVNDNTNVWVQYIMGGENRAGVDQKNMVVAGIKYSF